MSDAYRRGNRDALLSLAAEFDARAKAEDIEAERLSGHRTMGDRLAENRRWAGHAWTQAADLARRRAEAMPEDPEDDDEWASEDTDPGRSPEIDTVPDDLRLVPRS